MTTFITGKDVRIDTQYLHVELADGRIISTPLNWYQELQVANDQQRADHRFICAGTGIEWPMLDLQLSIESMLVSIPHQQAA
ncbi:DUF2442 domain-containing protein [Methylomonas montana]|uniref:DUF2442 domain-containing protein n=1 Tax=Methylomonas montana TaxID=3058963 RepID=UPI0026581E0E|nr:DUF2442 domain-containing protein [Methylomonas montana]WKJ89752.1 DUF2442 domain-containing protein [Methylomonas montana]